MPGARSPSPSRRGPSRHGPSRHGPSRQRRAPRGPAVSGPARAAVLHAAGDLRVERRAVPDPGPRQVRVRVGAGGICGSDLAYWLRGGFGTVRLGEPMVLGHEIAGVVEAVGAGVETVRPGEVVAVNPSLPCGACRFCARGLQNHCLDMRFLGSAMRTPHVQGGFCEALVCEEAQAVPLGPDAEVGEAAFAEPLAVALHAVARAGPLLGRRVLVAGSGPIGTLITAAARRAGAGEIWASDLHAEPLAIARAVGADATVDAGDDGALDGFERDRGAFDVAFEASGSPASLARLPAVVRPRGAIVQVGNLGEASLQMWTLTSKEIELRGAFRFHEEFAVAAGFIARRLIDVRPLLTDVVPLAEAARAFELAADRTRSMKVHLSFG